MIAAVRAAVLATPRRIWDALRDRARRRQAVARALETVAPAFGVLLLLGHGWRGALGGAVLVHLGEFAVFEWILEPLGWSGHYFERPRRDGTPYDHP